MKKLFSSKKKRLYNLPYQSFNLQPHLKLTKQLTNQLTKTNYKYSIKHSQIKRGCKEPVFPNTSNKQPLIKN
jgi:hypothetical protein